MATVLLVVVVVAFSRAHSTARVSRGYGINASTCGTQGAEDAFVFAKPGYKTYFAYGERRDGAGTRLMCFTADGGRRSYFLSSNSNRSLCRHVANLFEDSEVLQGD